MTRRKSIPALITAFTSVILEATLLQAGDASEPRVSGNGRFSVTGDNAALQRLKVDPSRRFLVRDDGTPFFWLGDTAWFIMRLTDDEIRYYLSNRVEKGFTGIQVDLNPYAWTNMIAPEECENPFFNNNPSTPNEKYWQRVDWMVDEAARHGLYVLLTPMWGKYYPRYVGTDTAKAYNLGKWLGNRYRDRTHVMWFVSGEYDSINGYRPITSAQKALLNAVAQGLEDGHGGNQLMTIHPGARRTSSVDFHNEAWLDFNMLQSGHFDDAEKWGTPETYTLITNDYNRTPTKPVFEGEPAYEDMIDAYFRGPRDGSGTRMGADVMTDEILQHLRKYGFRIMYGLFGYQKVFNNEPDNAEGMAKVKRFVKYSVDRWGAYVDFWEFLNEQKAADGWYEIMIPYLRSIDPYHHPITASWERPELDGIEINAPHWYGNENELRSDQVTVSRAKKWKQHGKPVIVGEQGNAVNRNKPRPPGVGGVWDEGSARRMRIRNWPALFN